MLKMKVYLSHRDRQSLEKHPIIYKYLLEKLIT